MDTKENWLFIVGSICWFLGMVMFAAWVTEQLFWLFH